MAQMAVTGLRLFGVVPIPERGAIPPLTPDTTLIPVRELGAVVRAAPYARVEMSDAEVEDYSRTVGAIFERLTIVPAPFGAVFRSAAQVARWLEIHYIALTEGVLFVDGRCEARVHITTDGEPPAQAEEAAKADGNALATDCFRTLRRQAAAAVPLRQSPPQTLLSGAFLVDRARWDEFADLVGEEGRRRAGLRFELTGPWPPYDFVRMDLGA
jgi:hypothetical protein